MCLAATKTKTPTDLHIVQVPINELHPEMGIQAEATVPW